MPAKKSKPFTVRGLIIPKEGGDLTALWKAFRHGSTWGTWSRSTRDSRTFSHSAYGGRLHLEWWGEAISFSISAPDTSGMIHGAFLGHVVRNSGGAVARVDLGF